MMSAVFLFWGYVLIYTSLRQASFYCIECRQKDYLLSQEVHGLYKQSGTDNRGYRRDWQCHGKTLLKTEPGGITVQENRHSTGGKAATAGRKIYRPEADVAQEVKNYGGVMQKLP